jgi:CBS domain-containing protein
MQASYLDRKAVDIAEKDVVMLEESTSVAEAVKTMRRKGVSSVFVGRRNSLVGIVTERDILYRVVAESRGPFKTVLKDIMSSPLVSIDEQATVKQAVSIMRQKGIRRLPIISKGQARGIVTLRSVVGNIPSQSIDLAEVDVPADEAEVSCPYCGSHFEDKGDLSKHIDRLHIGSGLLEGDMRQL